MRISLIGETWPLVASVGTQTTANFVTLTCDLLSCDVNHGFFNFFAIIVVKSQDMTYPITISNKR